MLANLRLFIRCSMFTYAGALVSPAAAVDIANLPMLQDGQLSLSNDMETKLTLSAINTQCARDITIAPKSAVAVGCSNLRSIRILIRWKLQDGRIVSKEQDLEVNQHYTLTWDDELKGYYRFGRIFDEQGRMRR